MPPWPGLPPSPMAEGHYFIVNKNLIEMLACLALVFIPTGHWIGLDAMLFGRRYRQAARSADATETSASHSAPGRDRRSGRYRHGRRERPAGRREHQHQTHSAIPL